MEAFLRTGWALCLALVLAAGVFSAPGATAAPLLSQGFGPAAASPLTATGACAEPDDCPTEIDIAPPYPAAGYRDDPIAREIEKLGPAPAYPCEGDTIVRGRRASPDADACGIRCWYWRLRHGYCGPGCAYYKYRFHNYPEGKPGHRASRHPDYACSS